MTHKLGALTIALSTLSVWLLSTSACSGGGGGGTVTDDDPEAVVSTGDVDREPTDESSSPLDGTSPPSPFEPDASSTPSGDDAVEEGTGAAGTPEETTATDNGPELQRPIGDGIDTAAIAGLWDYSRMTDGGVDTVYFAIDDSGGLIEYDDQADVTGSGLDCHVVTRGSIAARGDDRYDIQDSSTLPGSTSIDDVLITSDGTEITFRYLGTAADPQFGGNMTGITERYPAVTDRTADDLAICES